MDGDLREEGLKPPSINAILGPLRMAMTGAWQRELIPRRINPMALIKNLKNSPSEPRIMGPDELMRVLAVCDDQRRFLYVIQAFTGTRPAEAYWHWEHIDFRGSVIRIRQQLLEHHDVATGTPGLEAICELDSERNGILLVGSSNDKGLASHTKNASVCKAF